MSEYEKIIEILVLTQFTHWIEDASEKQTAEFINTRPQRAVDYYLGKTQKPMRLVNYEQVKFHSLIQLQTQAIIKELAHDTLTKQRDELVTACRDFMKFASKDLPKGFVPPEKWFDELKANTNNIDSAIDAVTGK